MKIGLKLNIDQIFAGVTGLLKKLKNLPEIRKATHTHKHIQNTQHIIQLSKI